MVVPIVGIAIMLALVPVIFTVLNSTISTLPGQMNSTELAPSYIVFKSDAGLTCAKNGHTDIITNMSSDSGSVIQYAINSTAAAGGGRVYIKEGLYDCSHTIWLPEYVIVQGAGQGHNTTLGATILYATMTDNTPLFQFKLLGGCDYFNAITDMELIGNPSSGPGIVTNPHIGSYTLTDQFVLANLHITQFGGDGICFPSRVEFATMQNLYIDQNGGNGISIDYLLIASEMTGLNIGQNGGDGIYFHSGIGNTITVYQSSGNALYGIRVDAGSNNKFFIAYTELNGIGGMYWTNCSGNMFDLGNVNDGFTIGPVVGLNTYQNGNIFVPAEIKTYWTNTTYLQMSYVRPSTSVVGFSRYNSDTSTWDGVFSVGDNNGFRLFDMILYKAPIDFADGATTPSVAHSTLLIAHNTNPTDITDFTNGTLGQIIYVQSTGTGITTLKNGVGNIFTSNGTDLVMVSYVAYTFIMFHSGRWDQA